MITNRKTCCTIAQNKAALAIGESRNVQMLLPWLH